MEIRVAFQILHIEETKDFLSIKQAYYNQLKENNPEDNPEGFKRLRQAFETANAYCEEKEIVIAENTMEKTAVSVWLDELKDLYENPQKRIKISNWEKLLSQSICYDLEDGLTIREQMLTYFMDHYRLDSKVWKLIDETFDIIKYKKQLQERFPANFLNYITSKVCGDETICYELFQLKDGADLDQYIKYYYDICNDIRSENWDGLDIKFQDITLLGVYHPYEDVERINYLVKVKKYDEAFVIAKRLEEMKQLNDDCDVMASIAQVYQCLGDIEHANELWKKILAKEIYFVSVVLGRANYLIEKEEYLAAKEVLTNALSKWGRYEPAKELLSKVNQHVIIYYKKEMELHPDNEKFKIDLAWSYLQEEQYDDCIALLNQYQPSEKKAYVYHQCYGRALLAKDEYKKAIPFLEKWNDILVHTSVDDQDDGKLIRNKLGLSYYLVGVCYCKSGDISYGIQQLEKAIVVETDENDVIRFKLYLASVYIEGKNYEKAIDLCDEIILYNPQHYSAYLTRQEANYGLRHGQEVIEDYDTLIQLYPNYYKPYLYAMKAFYNVNQLEDAAKIIEQAKRNQVEFSDEMRLYQWKIEMDSMPNEERESQSMAYIERYQSLIDSYNKEESDLKNLACIYCELGLLYWDNKQMEKSEEALRKAISEEDTAYYRVLYGDILRIKERYQEAINQYLIGQDSYIDSVSYWYNVAICYQNTSQVDEAIQKYEKVYLLDKDYRDVRIELADLYKYKYQDTYQKEFFSKAIQYLNEQIEQDENWYILNTRGLMYLDNFDFEEAIADFERALTYSPQNPTMLQNLGLCYKYMHQYEKAMVYWNDAERLLKKQEGEGVPVRLARLYTNMASCYLNKKQYKDAIKYYEQAYELQPTNYRKKKMLVTYKLAQDDDVSKRMLFEIIRNDLAHRNINDMYDLIYYSICAKDKYTLANGMNWLSELEREHNGYGLCRRGVFKESYEGDFEGAKILLEKGIEMLGDQAYTSYFYSLMICYYMLGDMKKAEACAQKYLNRHGGMDGYRNYLDYKPECKLYHVKETMVLLCMGREQEALERMEKIDSLYLCEDCVYGKCYDILIVKARYYEKHNQLEAALQAYEEAYQINPTDSDVRCGVYRLGGKMVHKKQYKKFLKIMKKR